MLELQLAMASLQSFSTRISDEDCAFGSFGILDLERVSMTSERSPLVYDAVAYLLVFCQRFGAAG